MGELIINDSTPHDVLFPDGTPNDVLFPTDYSRGLELAARPLEGLVYGDAASPFPAELLIPKTEWQARIQEMEERKSRVSDLCDNANLPVKDQNGNLYCWVNAPTHCVEIIRVLQGQKTQVLSAASAGAQIKNYWNVGGWGLEALQWIIAHGLVPVEQWPNTAINRKYATPENLQLALNYRVDEWWELEAGNIDQLISCLLRRIPVAVGYNWWSHEVTAVDAVWLDGAIAIRIDNSWGTAWGTKGRGILQGWKMSPNDACAARVVKAI